MASLTSQTESGQPTPYDRGFFRDIQALSESSARVVCPLVLSFFPVKSVVDVGCGEGNWLRVFLNNGVPQILGIDGDYVDRSRLVIPPDRFLARDLTQPLPASVGRFDLAVSVEVAEHLPPESAAQFVASLTALSDKVMFSAAIPEQGGVHHVNEQWPSYWKKLFEERGFVMIDCLREQIWDNPEVEACYRQNVFLCVRREELENLPALRLWADRPVRDLVHPLYYDRAPRAAWITLRTAAIAQAKRSLGIKGSFREAFFPWRRSAR